MNWFLRVLWSIWAIPWVVFITLAVSSSVVVGGLCGASENFLQRLARAWGRWLLIGIGCRVSIHGQENLKPDQPYVFACNHSSALDIPVLFKALPNNFRWIAKKELFAIPVFGPAMRMAGYIPIDRSNRRAAMHSLEVASSRIKAGASVVIFPEGTRSQDGRLGEFKSGGFLLALKAEQPVTPVFINGSYRILPPHCLWMRPGKISVHIGQPLPVALVDIKQRDSLAQTVREQLLQLAAAPNPAENKTIGE